MRAIHPYTVCTFITQYSLICNTLRVHIIIFTQFCTQFFPSFKICGRFVRNSSIYCMYIYSSMTILLNLQHDSRAYHNFVRPQASEGQKMGVFSFFDWPRHSFWPGLEIKYVKFYNKMLKEFYQHYLVPILTLKHSLFELNVITYLKLFPDHYRHWTVMYGVW